MHSVADDEALYEEFIDIVEKRLKKHNQFLTKNKKIVLNILYNKGDYLSVEEIVACSLSSYENKLSLTTVYRILSTFEKFGVVESLSIEDKKRYELTYQKTPHYHLYCEECGKIFEFYSFDIEKLFDEKLKEMDFKPTSFNVLINGVCKDCRLK